MTTGRTVVKGSVGEGARHAIERCIERAAGSLELPAPVTVHVTASARDLPAGLIAGAGLDGIWVSAEVLKDDGFSVASTLLEEAAHLKLTQLGVPSGLETFHGALLQEFFATWYAWYELLRADPALVDRYHDGPILGGAATQEVGYRLGSILGASGAGIPAARRRVDDWLARRQADPVVYSAAVALRRAADGKETPIEMARAVAGVAR